MRKMMADKALVCQLMFVLLLNFYINICETVFNMSH